MVSFSYRLSFNKTVVFWCSFCIEDSNLLILVFCREKLYVMHTKLLIAKSAFPACPCVCSHWFCQVEQALLASCTFWAHSTAFSCPAHQTSSCPCKICIDHNLHASKVNIAHSVSFFFQVLWFEKWVCIKPKNIIFYASPGVTLLAPSPGWSFFDVTFLYFLIVCAALKNIETIVSWLIQYQFWPRVHSVV